MSEISNNLPIPLSSFIGREREIADIKRLLSTCRLLTLTGAGGCGKTRLAIQVASDLTCTYPDGVWWVELAALADETLVPQAIAQTLGVREVPIQALNETLANHLRAKELVLVIDNWEHLVRACAQLVEHLLQACPNLKILSASREPLALGGETVYPLSPLSLPEPNDYAPTRLLQSEAVRLFVERARAVKPDWDLTEQNARHRETRWNLTSASRISRRHICSSWPAQVLPQWPAAWGLHQSVWTFRDRVCPPVQRRWRWFFACWAS